MDGKDIAKLINSDNGSMKKQRAREAGRYYEAAHDILGYRVLYVNGNGDLTEDKTRSNIRIPHPFFTEMVDQKVQYLLSNDQPLVCSDIPELQEQLDQYFGDAFIDQLTELETYASIHGWGYLYAYMGEESRTQFQYADALSVTEAAKEVSGDGVAHVLYTYTVPYGKDEQRTYVQDWTEKDVTTYISRSKDGTVKNLVLAEDAGPNPRPHKIYQRDAELLGEEYDTIPFFRLDNNRKQQSDLRPIKPLIDDYDLMACGLSNNLQDITEGIYVVKGFMGDDMDEMITNLRAKKAIGTTGDGGVDIKTIDIPYQARQAKLELDERNIYKFGMGFNAAQVGDGNVTNVVIKSRYALLDLKCNKAEARLRTLLRQLLDVVLPEINQATDKGYTQKDVKFDFTRILITSESDDAATEQARQTTRQIRLSMLMQVYQLLDHETAMRQILELLDIDYESVADKLPQDPYNLEEAAKALEALEAQLPPDEDTAEPLSQPKAGASA